MADRTFQILTPAASNDLLTLQELKLMLGMSATDTSQDAALSFLISVFSEECARRCNHYGKAGMPPTFAKIEVQETWREVMPGRIFCLQWPVNAVDLVSVTDGGVQLTTDQFELEEHSGKISNVQSANISMTGAGSTMPSPWVTPVVVHYSGGYVLPNEAPLPLKHAVVMLVRQERILMMQAQYAGIRSLSHKEARVMFFDPNAVLLRALGTKSPVVQAVDNLLDKYRRLEV